MLRIGLTGGIGSGKTIVAGIFESLGVPVYYADENAKRIMQYDLHSDIIELFGKKAFQLGSLNREYIAGIVFNHPEKLKALNAIVHPAVKNDFIKWSAKYQNLSYVIQEAALIFESGTNKLMNYTIVVHASEEVRIERVIRRDNADFEEVKARMENQMDPDKKKELADFVILNEGNEMLLPQVLDLHNKFVSLQS